jgi:hypothetical protein
MQKIKLRNCIIGLGDIGDILDCELFPDGTAICRKGRTSYSICSNDFEIMFARSNGAIEFLSRAQDIMKQRAQQYDKTDGERSMDATVKAFNAITGRDLTESEGWLLMLLLKNVRQWQKPEYHADSAEDAVAYSALLAEALAKGK